jgi:hypothetical protein
MSAAICDKRFAYVLFGLSVAALFGFEFNLRYEFGEYSFVIYSLFMRFYNRSPHYLCSAKKALTFRRF